LNQSHPQFLLIICIVHVECLVNGVSPNYGHQIL
jgi:hypothetical protein